MAILLHFPKKILFFSLFLLATGLSNAQGINFRAKTLRNAKLNGQNIQILEGDVNFEQNGNIVYVDRATANGNNLDGVGNVRINSAEGVYITGERLYFNSETKQARVEGNVVLRDKGMTLTTPWIQYQTDSKVGWYGSGGKIVDNGQILTSQTGSYNPNLHMLYFKGNVVLTAPEYVMKSDTLQYNNETGTAYFFNYTEITDGENTILCNYGSYNTKTGKSFFTKNAALISKENIIRADSLYYDRNNGIGEALGRLWVKDTQQKIIILGSKGYYDKINKYTRVTGKPIAKQFDGKDSLQIAAETFEYWQDTQNNKRTLSAHGKAKLFQKEFSGTADSIAYVVEDSVFKLYKFPVLWNENTRINADTVFIFLKSKKVKHMQLRRNSFVCIDEGLEKYSQISGINMDNAFNAQQSLETVMVRGSGKSVYYIKENDTAISAMNFIECENMKIVFDSGSVEKVKFYKQPKGNMFPIDQVNPGQEKLAAFVWDPENKPTAAQFIPQFVIPELPKYRKDIVKRISSKK